VGGGTTISIWIIFSFGYFAFWTHGYDDSNAGLPLSVPLPLSASRSQQEQTQQPEQQHEQQQQLPFLIYVQSPMMTTTTTTAHGSNDDNKNNKNSNTSSINTTSYATVRKLLPSLSTRNSTKFVPMIDCHTPYRTLPVLLEIDEESHHTGQQQQSLNADPFLPWIHDYFVNEDQTQVIFVAQNRRRCYTGINRRHIMAYWEPQMALFQPVHIRKVRSSSSQSSKNNTNNASYTSSTHYMITDHYNHQNHHHHDNLSDANDVIETRFQCRFHQNNKYDSNNEEETGSIPLTTTTTFSVYPFNYEYIHWRKRGNTQPMFVKDGPDVKIFDYATLLFACPIPTAFRHWSTELYYLDVVPIRTSTRYNNGYALSRDQVGPKEFVQLSKFNTDMSDKDSHESILPPFDHVGRYENLPICNRGSTTSPTERQQDTTITTTAISDSHDENEKKLPATHRNGIPRPKRYMLVGCAWVAATYVRRGGHGASVTDVPTRLREWLTFHRHVGFDHIYLYDNTQDVTADNNHTENDDNDDRFVLKQIADLFPQDFVTWIRWPVKVCNNNFIGGRWPGERSSQYAAEASCRERFGPTTEWMSFFDVDEYLIPLQNDTWKHILERKGTTHPVLGLRESRALPRIEMMDQVTNEVTCRRSPDEQVLEEGAAVQDATNTTCLVPRHNTTYLSLYNCDTVKPPRPRKYFRNMKQIYRPDFVLSHFVHYSTVTRPMAEYYRDKVDPSSFRRIPSAEEKYVILTNSCVQNSYMYKELPLTRI
jgi:hypothetical protein